MREHLTKMWKWKREISNRYVVDCKRVRMEAVKTRDEFGSMELVTYT